MYIYLQYICGCYTFILVQSSISAGNSSRKSAHKRKFFQYFIALRLHRVVVSAVSRLYCIFVWGIMIIVVKKRPIYALSAEFMELSEKENTSKEAAQRLTKNEKSLLAPSQMEWRRPDSLAKLLHSR